MSNSNNQLMINKERLLSTFDVSSSIGSTPNGGLTRLGLTKEDKEMRDVFIKWLEDEGLETRIDDVGNIYGRREGRSPNKSAVMSGSHLDTQPVGGRFDGILGVLAALEVVRTLNEHNIETERPIEIVNFTTEEGARFGVPMEGSGVITDNYTKEYVYNLKDKDGITFKEALESIGYKGDKKNRFKNIDYFVELHAEQGPKLDSSNTDIGIVTGIKGVTKYQVELKGQAVHAAHPAELRKDALVAAAHIITAIDDVTKDYEESSTTVGKFEISPSHLSMVTENVDFSFDIRHPDDETRKKIFTIIEEKISTISKSRDIEYSIEKLWNMDGTTFSTNIMKVIEEKADHLKYSGKKVISGAGQDAKFMQDIAETGMIFASSYKGLGHCEAEFTSDENIEKTTNVLLHTILELANR